jgi:hypothetical protein
MKVKFAPDSALEETRFELPVRGRGQSGCRPFYAAESLGQVGAPSSFWTARRPASKRRGPDRRGRNPCRRRTAPKFCVVREENGNALPGDRARRSRPGARQLLVPSKGAAAGPLMRRAAMRAAAVKCRRGCGRRVRHVLPNTHPQNTSGKFTTYIYGTHIFAIENEKNGIRIVACAVFDITLEFPGAH